jgi:hypothetical protein
MASKDKPTLVMKDVICPNCGSLIRIEESEEQTCPACKTRYAYSPEINIVPQLVFERESRSPFVYEVNANVLLGRDSQGFVTLSYADYGSIREYPNIRSNYVSGTHARISVDKSYEIPKGNRDIVCRLRCTIEDDLTLNGTMVNDGLLKPGEVKELANNDVIVLAPKSRRAVRITFKEKMVA